jgi:hypothetical protein
MRVIDLFVDFGSKKYQYYRQNLEINLRVLSFEGTINA